MLLTVLCKAANPSVNIDYRLPLVSAPHDQYIRFHYQSQSIPTVWPVGPDIFHRLVTEAHDCEQRSLERHRWATFEPTASENIIPRRAIAIFFGVCEIGSPCQRLITGVHSLGRLARD